MSARAQPGRVHACGPRSHVSPLFTLVHAPRFHPNRLRWRTFSVTSYLPRQTNSSATHEDDQLAPDVAPSQSYTCAARCKRASSQ